MKYRGDDPHYRDFIVKPVTELRKEGGRITISVNQLWTMSFRRRSSEDQYSTDF